MLFNLNTNKKLGAKEISFTNEDLLNKTTAERFGMKKSEVVKHGVDLTKVKDINGMLMSVQALGDDIATTIRKGSNVTSLNFKKLVNEEGKLGNNATTVALLSADLYAECFDYEAKCLNMTKAANIVAGRKGTKMPVVYTPEDVRVSLNKFGVKRNIYTVNDFYLQICRNFLNSINEDTTLEELESFQSAFEFPTRGLGEQTIDVAKHIDYTFIVKMSDLISPYVTVVGGIKELKSNIDEARRIRGTAPLYEIEVPGAKEGSIQLSDCIGDMMLTCVAEMESTMQRYIDALDGNSYNAYHEYESIGFENDAEVELTMLIDRVEDSLLVMDDATKERCLYAIYRKAIQLGIDPKRVVKLGLRLAISQSRTVKGGKQVMVSVLGTDNERKADIWKVATLFNDIFVAEYAGTDTLEIEVDYESETDIAVDTIIEITDGYGLDGQLHILDSFQNGQVKVIEKDGLYKLVALYNPLETLMSKYEGTNPVIIPVKDYNKENVKFSELVPSMPEDIDAGKSYGYNALADNDLAKLFKKEDLVVLFSVENNSPVAAAMCRSEYSYEAATLNLVNTMPFKGFVLADIIK